MFVLLGVHLLDAGDVLSREKACLEAEPHQNLDHLHIFLSVVMAVDGYCTQQLVQQLGHLRGVVLWAESDNATT